MTGPHGRKRSSPDLLMAGVIAAATIAFVCGMSWRGLDLMDESYSLRLTQFPDASKPAGEPYLVGFLLHPVLQLCQGDIGAFRLLGFAVTAAVSALTARSVLGVYGAHSHGTSLRRVVVLVCVSTSLMVYQLEIRVPSYRSVTVLGLLVATAGVAMVLRRRAWPGGVVLGLGGWLAFSGKPTSAALLAAVVLTMVVSRRLPWQAAVGALASAAGGAAVTLAIAGLSPAEATWYLRNGARLVTLLSAYPDVLTILGGSGVRPFALLLLGTPFALLFVVLLVRHRTDGGDCGPRLVPALVLVASAAAVATGGIAAFAPRTLGYQMLAFGVLLLLPVVHLGWGHLREMFPRGSARVMAVVLLLMPYAYAIGSNRDVLTTTGMAAVFWALLCGVAVLHADAASSPDDPPAAGISLLFVALVPAVVVAVAFGDGPEGPELSRAGTAAPVAGGSLRLDPETAAVMTMLHEVAAREGVTRDTPVVDLSGMGAGYALGLGGRPLGRAHFYAFRDGNPSAAFALSMVPCIQRAGAWLVVADVEGIRPAWAEDWGAARATYRAAASFSALRYGAVRRFDVLVPGPRTAAALGCRRGEE